MSRKNIEKFLILKGENPCLRRMKSYHCRSAVHYYYRTSQHHAPRLHSLRSKGRRGDDV